MNMRGKIKLIDLENRIEFPTPAEASQPSPWVDLPLDVTANILRRLDTVEILQSEQLVCTKWRNICQDPSMWRVINIVNTNLREEELTMMCRRAVDRSQGQLIDLTISYFGYDGLLNYIVYRSSHLRRLTLASCIKITRAAVNEAIKKLPELEELNLIRPSFIFKMISIYSYCPTLKSFTLDLSHCSQHSDDEFRINDGALAIAKNIPNLRHLGIFANGLNNEGLQAILDGCPHLESLDLRGCYGVYLEGELGMRCFE